MRRAFPISELERIPIKRTIICGIPKYPSPHANAETIPIPLNDCNSVPANVWKLLKTSETLTGVLPEPIEKITMIVEITNATKIKEP